jgi:cystine transport system substrate-binding protein
MQALVKKGNEGVIKTAADLKGKKVGVGLGTNYEEWLRQNVRAWISAPMMMTRRNTRICA